MFEKREEKGRKLEKKKRRTVWRRRWKMSFVLGFLRLGRGEWDGRWLRKKMNEGRRK